MAWTKRILGQRSPLNLSNKKELVIKMLEHTIKDLNDPIQSVREDALRYMMKFDAYEVCRDNGVDDGVAAKFFEITYKVASEDKGVRRQKAVMDGVKELRRTVIEGYRI